ncbi:MAG: sulfatase-like hydrolase/transferase [Myxococcales bacterium]|nr:sulfatase-like hydrolase/transferase [Myxococcales bacterium]
MADPLAAAPARSIGAVRAFLVELLLRGATYALVGALAAALCVALDPIFMPASRAERVMALTSIAFTVAPALGALIGLGAFLAAEVVGALVRAVGWLQARRGRPRPSPSVGAVPVIAVAVLVALQPAHATFARHELGAALYPLYAFTPLVLVIWAIDRLRRALRAGRLRHLGLVVALFLVAAGIVMHLANSRFFYGLYPRIHEGLTALTFAALIGACTLLEAHHRGRRLLRLSLGLAGLALIGGLNFDLAAARNQAFFYGTETRHLISWVEGAFDADHDGVPGGPLGVDCDDHDPDVNPLQFEVPGDARDENCRLGPRPDGPPAPSSRAVPPVAALQAWQAAHGQPDIVMFFIDTLRWDAIGQQHADWPAASPHLDALAAESVVFTQARTTAPRTPHAWMSIIRGRFVGRTLRCRRQLRRPQGDALPSLLMRSGYRTMARLVGRSWARFQLANGYTRLLQAQHVKRRTGDKVTNDVLRLLDQSTREAPERPVFLVAHYADAHAPYQAPSRFAGERTDLVGRYLAEVRSVDHEVGRVLAWLRAHDRLDRTVVVVFADHGENLGDHGAVGGHHGVSVYDEVIRVPLLMRVPGVKPRRIDDAVSVVDIAPTLLDLAHGLPLDDPDGASLAGYFFDAPPPPRPTISEFYDFGHRLQAIVDGRLKLVYDVRHGVHQLFDLQADPYEAVDVAQERPDDAARLMGLLDAYFEHRVDPSEGPSDRCTGLVDDPIKSAK